VSSDLVAELLARPDDTELRRVIASDFDEHRNELWIEQIAPGSHPRLLAARDRSDRSDPADAAMRRAAAQYLLAWAEHFRIRFAHGRAPEEAARIAQILYATAAVVDPLEGEVHYQWAQLDRRTTRREGQSSEEELAAYRRARPLSRANLERALAINPDHVEALGDLGIVCRELGELDRAIELLERYRAVFRATRRPELGRGMYWDYRTGHLWRAYHERAVLRMFGVPVGVNRPPRPCPARTATLIYGEATGSGFATHIGAK
jgi:hypothetical protein